MNIREGTRRLALLLGVVGAILGGFASYLELQTVLSQSARHNRFEQLAASEVVKQQRKALKSPPDFIPDSSDKWAVAAAEYQRQQAIVDKDGIKTIHWTANADIESIETQDGQTHYPTPAPSAWLYLLVAIFPIAGFFIPWGAVRAIGWVVTGFVQPSK
jgi:hypothetical protein